MEKANNPRFYAVHVQPLETTEIFYLLVYCEIMCLMQDHHPMSLYSVAGVVRLSLKLKKNLSLTLKFEEAHHTKQEKKGSEADCEEEKRP